MNDGRDEERKQHCLCFAKNCVQLFEDVEMNEVMHNVIPLAIVRGPASGSPPIRVKLAAQSGTLRTDLHGDQQIELSLQMHSSSNAKPCRKKEQTQQYLSGKDTSVADLPGVIILNTNWIKCL